MPDTHRKKLLPGRLPVKAGKSTQYRFLVKIMAKITEGRIIAKRSIS